MLTGDEAGSFAGVKSAGASGERGAEESGNGGKNGGGGRRGQNELVALIGQGAMAVGACTDEAAGCAVRAGGHELVRGRQA
jgi:hypothetical protein